MRSDPLPDWVITRRQQIGLRFAIRRQSLGLVIDDVAEATGLNRKTVMAVERAENAAGIDTLLLIAEALDCDLADLVSGDRRPPQ